MALYVNGKLVVHKGSGATVQNQDTCIEVIVPFTYSTNALAKDAENTSQNVSVNGNPVCHKESYFSQSYGAESANPGSGVTSGTVGEKAEFTTWSPNVFFDGIAAVMHGAMMVSNNKNTPPNPVQVPGQASMTNLHAAAQQQQQSPPTPYCVDIDVVGTFTEPCNELVTLYDKTQGYRQASVIWEGMPEQTNLATRRLEVPNTLNIPLQLTLAVPNTLGPALFIPLSLTATSRDKIHVTPPAAGQAATILVPVQLAWNSMPSDGTLTPPAAKNFTDIARFSDSTRAMMYADLYTAPSDPNSGKTPEQVTTQLNSQPWTSLIKATTHQQVQAELSAFTQVPPGWLYVYKNGYLWRELFVDTNGQLHELDLKQFAGYDRRFDTMLHASGAPNPYLLLPYKIDHQVQTLEVAYSATPWSWSRINYFGGIDPTDPRIKGKTVLMPTGTQKAKASQARSKRFQAIDLSPFVSPSAEIGVTHTGDSQQPTLKLLDETRVPRLFLTNPWGFVSRIQQDLNDAWQSLQQCLQSVQQDDYFKTAALSYPLFFDKKNAYSQQATVPSYPTPTLLPANQTVTTQTDPLSASQYLDKSKLEAALHVTARAWAREKIRFLQTLLIQVADTGSHYCHQPIDFNDQLLDAFASGDYPNAFAALTGIVSHTVYDPWVIDNALDVNVPTPFPDAPGQAYLASLHQSSHPLYKAIFPTDAMVKAWLTGSLNYNGYCRGPQQAVADVYDTGDGTFNPNAFLAYQEPFYQANDFFAAAFNQWASYSAKHVQATAKPDDAVTKSFLNLTAMWGVANFASTQHYTDMKLAETGSIPAGFSIIGFSSPQLTKIGAIFNQQALPQKGAVQLNYVVKDTSGNYSNPTPIGSFTAENYKTNSGAAYQQYDFRGVHDALATGDVGKKLKLQVWIAPISKVGVMATASLGMVLQAVNLATVSEGMKKYNTKAEKRTYLAEVILYSLYMIEQTYVAFAGKDKVLNVYKTLLPPRILPNAVSNVKDFSEYLGNTRLKSALTPLAILGIVGGIANTYLSCCALRTALQNGEKGEAFGSALQLVGSALQTISIFQEYAVKKQAVQATNAKTNKAADTTETPAAEAGGEVVGAEAVEETGAVVATEATEALLWGFGPLTGLIGSILIIIGTVVEALCASTPLETWAKQSPFAKNANEKKTDWTDQMASEQLLSALYLPQVKVQSAGPGQVTTTISLPRFVIGVDTLEVVLTQQPLFSPTNGLPVAQTMAPNVVVPYAIREVGDDKGHIIEMSYNYQKPANPGAFASSQWLAKVRLHLEHMAYTVQVNDSLDNTNDNWVQDQVELGA